MIATESARKPYRSVLELVVGVLQALSVGQPALLCQLPPPLRLVVESCFLLILVIQSTLIHHTEGNICEALLGMWICMLLLVALNHPSTKVVTLT